MCFRKEYPRQGALQMIPVASIAYLRADAKYTLVAWRDEAGRPAEALVRDIRDAGGRAIAVAGPISCASGSAWRCSTCSSSASAA